jgi:hypothetical protein
MRVLATIFAVEKQKSITYSESVFVTVGIQHTMQMRHIVACDLPGSAIFLHIIT